MIWLVAVWASGVVSLPADTPQSVAQAVLDRLYATNGNYRFTKPKLSLTPENKKVAAYTPWKNTITLDKKAYDICRSFGRDSLAALAYIIGHELVHAYQSDIRGQRVRTNFLAYDRNYNADVRTEKVADIQGLFNAYMAGYGVLKTMPEVIERLYEAYDLKGRPLAGYPTLEERRRTGEEAVAIADKLREVFESCSYLLAIGQTSLACTGYEYILQYYQGIEVYNNLGLAYTRNAQQFWNPKTDVYIYPLEADWYSKITRLATARGQEQIDPTVEPLRLAFLDKAIQYLGEAARLDPGYLPAHINTVCALDMAGRPVEALKYAELHLLKIVNGKKRRKAQETDMAEIALGISYALQPGGARRTEAEAIFQRLSGSAFLLSALYAQQNQKSLKGKIDTEILTEMALPEPFRQAIGRMEFGRNTDLERTLLDEQNGIQMGTKRGLTSTTVVFSNERGNLVSMMRFTNRLAADVSVLALGEDLKTSAYRNVLSTREGFFLCAPRDRAVLKIDAQGRVLEMVKYIEHGQGGG